MIVAKKMVNVIVRYNFWRVSCLGAGYVLVRVGWPFESSWCFLYCISRWVPWSCLDIYVQLLYHSHEKVQLDIKIVNKMVSYMNWEDVWVYVQITHEHSKIVSLIRVIYLPYDWQTTKRGSTKSASGQVKWS